VILQVGDTVEDIYNFIIKYIQLWYAPFHAPNLIHAFMEQLRADYVGSVKYGGIWTIIAVTSALTFEKPNHDSDNQSCGLSPSTR